MAHGQRRAALDAGGAIADDPVEGALKGGDDLLDTFRRQVVLVAGLGGRQQIERFQALVAD